MLLLKIYLTIGILFLMNLVFIQGRESTNIKDTTRPSVSHSKHIQKRSGGHYYYDYPENSAYYDYPGHPEEYQTYGGNPLKVLSVAGSAGLGLKALKAKSILKLLKIPLGIGLVGAALAAGLAPPAVIGSISLPFQGKRKKRSTDLQKLDPHFLHLHRTIAAIVFAILLFLYNYLMMYSFCTIPELGDTGLTALDINPLKPPERKSIPTVQSVMVFKMCQGLGIPVKLAAPTVENAPEVHSAMIFKMCEGLGIRAKLA
ncbi:hypothetical protein HNY73_021062 [Argiope bruennichi]|uniref:Uncharacterized protein n=1 Tax=Argiope bruennichi TaxID=94029 RepID=A0A8T0EA65_ARGBR|nr:hypothetical protein HNY73_021062 [Argiope bruennichi]